MGKKAGLCFIRNNEGNILRYLICFAWLLISFTAVASDSDYTVTVPITSDDMNEIRQVARVKAQWKAALDLPVVVGGQANLSADGEYSEEIKALALAAMDVKTLSETWDHESGVYTLKARVNLDESKTASLLTEVTNNKKLKSQLASLHSTILKVIQSNRMTGDIREFDNALNATQAFILSLDDKAREAAEYELKLLYHKMAIDYLVTPVMTAFEYHVESKTDHEMRIRISNRHVINKWGANLGWKHLGGCPAEYTYPRSYSWRERMASPHADYSFTAAHGLHPSGGDFSIKPIGCVFADVFKGTVYEAEPLAFSLRFKPHHRISGVNPKVDGLAFHISVRNPSEVLKSAVTNADFTKELFIAELHVLGGI